MSRHYDDAISEADWFDHAPDGDDDEPCCLVCGSALFTEEHRMECSVGDEIEDEDA